MAKTVNQTELAVFHGVSDVTIWQWQKEGMPIAKVNTRGLSNEYDVASTIDWRIQREVRKVRDESPRDALARAQTQLALQTYAEKERKLVLIDEVEPAFTRLVVQARQSLLQILGLMRAVLTEAQHKLLEGHLLEALKELSVHEPNPADDEEGSGPLGAAAAPIAGGMGGGQAPVERQVAVPGQVPAVDHAVPAGGAGSPG